MILLTGATGYTGGFLLPRLVEQGAAVRCLVRHSSDCRLLKRFPVEIRAGDLGNPAEIRPALEGVRQLIHLAGIRHAPALLEWVEPGVERLVLVSSQRRFSQAPSASVEEVTLGETAVLHSGLPWVLLRPTMIYGPGDDRNLSRLAAYWQKRRWIPVFGDGRALQQPVHVEDVVQALLAALHRPGTVHRIYDLAGPAALSFDQLIDQVAAAVGVAPAKVHLPVGLALAGLWAARRLGIKTGIDPEQVRRLQEDKSCSIEAARAELGFAPRSLAQGLGRIYARGSVP